MVENIYSKIYIDLIAKQRCDHVLCRERSSINFDTKIKTSKVHIVFSLMPFILLCHIMLLICFLYCFSTYEIDIGNCYVKKTKYYLTQIPLLSKKTELYLLYSAI